MADTTCATCRRQDRLAELIERRMIISAELNRLWSEAASARRDLKLVDAETDRLIAAPA